MNKAIVRLVFTIIGSILFAAQANAQTRNPDLLVVNSPAPALPPVTNNDVFRYDGQTGTYVRTMTTGDDLDIVILGHSIAVGPYDGNLYVFDQNTRAVLRYDIFTGVFLDVFVPAGSGGLSATGNLVFGPDKNLYLIDSFSHSVLRYNGLTGAFIDVFVPAASGGLRDTYASTFGPDGDFYVANGNANVYTIVRFNGTTGAFVNSFVPTGVVVPQDMTFGPDGKLYVVSFLTNDVRRYDSATGILLNVFVTATGPITSIVFGPNDGNLYLTSGDPGQILRYNGLTGAFIDVFVPTGSPNLYRPLDLVFMPSGIFSCILANGTSSTPLTVQLRQPYRKLAVTTTSPSGCYAFPAAAPGKFTITIHSSQ